MINRWKRYVSKTGCLLYAHLHAIFGLKWKRSVISLSRYVLSHCKSELIVSWNPWLTSLLRLYRKACYANKPRGPVSILSVLFFIPFCRFRGNNRFRGDRFFHRRGGDCFFVLCHINCMEILTTTIYLFHIKTWNFLYKNPCVFYSIFLSQQTSQTSLFLIA